jgi:hypothetical protein
MDPLEEPARRIQKTARLLQTLVAVPFIGLVAAGWKTLGHPGLEAWSLPLFGLALLLGIVGGVGASVWQQRAVKKLAAAHGLDPVELRMRAWIH